MPTARQEILNKLANAINPLPEKPDFAAPLYPPLSLPLDEAFKQCLERVSGSVYLFSSEYDLYKQLNTFLSAFKSQSVVCFEDEIVSALKSSGFPLLEHLEVPENMEVGITGCEYLIARTGSILASSAQKGGRKMLVYPPVHVVVASRSQLVENLSDAYNLIVEKYKDNLPSHITLITGPSRTADIEKSLVMGAHGPKELHVFLT
ncbi:MAG: hypothetical protein CSA36_03710 [Draconibacterium sp.]|nr:MAG: hypothetical protein CSA36_03710 [Draconibacterium sp.]